MLNVTSIVPTDARNGGSSLLSSSRPSSVDKYQESPMLISPPAEDLELSDTAPQCTGCKSASPAVANCFSCSSLTVLSHISSWWRLRDIMSQISVKERSKPE